MKRYIPAVFLCAVLAVLLPGKAPGLDLRIQGGTGNVSFDTTRESSLAGETFNPRLYPAGLVSFSGIHADWIHYSAAFERDPVLRNRLTAAVGLDLSFVKFEAGVLIGPFNTREKPISPGAMGGLTLTWPGVIFGSVKGSSTLGSSLGLTGDYIQETAEIAFGFWVPNVICGFSFSSAGFSRRSSEILIIKDQRTRYQFTADVHAKNVPYTVKVNMGYQNLGRLYSPAGSAFGVSDTDELKSVFLGFEGAWRVVPGLQILAGAEMPLYSWAKEPMKKPDSNAALFSVHAGVIWTLAGKTR
ncbi:MAG: hypothetical protein LBD71_04500 [Treponema sp.]|jgi:hypothetical protein|nr:hypothetical protein [Treponema sp.]